MAPAIQSILQPCAVVATSIPTTTVFPTRCFPTGWSAIPTHVLQTRHRPSERGIGTQGSAGYAEECDAETEWEYVFELWEFYAVGMGGGLCGLGLRGWVWGFGGDGERGEERWWGDGVR